jgi:hypothetical protein
MPTSSLMLNLKSSSASYIQDNVCSLAPAAHRQTLQFV